MYQQIWEEAISEKNKIAIKNFFDCIAHYLDKMQNTNDGEGSLLDNSITLFASSISDGHKHSRANLPVLLAGGGVGQVNGGRHLRYADDTPLTNLCLSMLDICGVTISEFGDSTGKLDLHPVA